MGGREGRAFTLIEILMSLMILAVGLASVLSVFVVGVRASRNVVDESALAVTSKAVLARVLAEDVDTVDTDRDFLKAIEETRLGGKDWVWFSRDPSDPGGGAVPAIEKIDGLVTDPDPVESAKPAPKPTAPDSVFSWRCRASRFRGDPDDPLKDLEVGGTPIPLKDGRVPLSQSAEDNPDADELWRLSIEVFRDYREGDEPLAVYTTYVCTAHR